jgi:hypothetical protein
MPTTACTSYYTTVVRGIANNVTGGTSIVTFTTPTPVWSNTTGGTINECSSVTLGGFNGLNN